MLQRTGKFWSRLNALMMHLLFMVAFVACENSNITPENKPLPVVSVEIGIGQASEYTDQDDPSQDAPITPSTPSSLTSMTGLHFLTPTDQTRLNEMVRGLALDSQGNLIVVGHENTSTTVTSTSVGTSDPTSYYLHDARADVFIRKLSPSGETIWSRQFGGSDYEYARAIAVGPDDTVFVVGMTDSKIVRGLNIRFFEDAFITAYSKDGKRLWTRVLGGNLSDAATAIAVDQKGYVYVTGYTTGVHTPSEFPHRSFMGTPIPGLLEVFLAKYNAKGVRLWTKMIGKNSDGIQHPGGVAVNSKGEVLLAGTTFRGLPEAGNEHQGFLMHFAADGTALTKPTLFKSDDPMGDISVRSISIDPTDNVILAGGTTAQLLSGQTSTLIAKINQVLGPNAFCRLGRDIIPSGRANDGTFGSCADGYIAKFNPQLEPVWTRLVSNDVALGLKDSKLPERQIELHTVRTDPTGNIFVLGYGYTPKPPRSQRFLTANWPLKYSSDGAFLGTAPELSTDIHEVVGVSGIVSDRLGNLFVSGEVGLRDSAAAPKTDWVFPVEDASGVGSGFNSRAFVTHLNAEFK